MSVQQPNLNGSQEIYKKISKFVPENEWKIHAPLIEKINKLKNKLRRRLLPIKTQDNVKTGDELKFNNTTIGKVLIGGHTPFALVKLFDPDFTEFKNKEISINNKKAKLINVFV